MKSQSNLPEIRSCARCAHSMSRSTTPNRVLSKNHAERIAMRDWIIPGLYVLVYLDKRAQGFDLVRHLDLERPFVVCPNLEGSRWRYLRRKLKQINTIAIRQIVTNTMEVISTSEGEFSASITPPRLRIRPDVTQLVELMFAHAFLPADRLDIMEAMTIAENQIRKIGFDSTKFFAEIIRVDYGIGRMQEYCLMGGPNRLVHNDLIKDTANDTALKSLVGRVSTAMNEKWHASIASYLGVILWSKVKVSPVLREALIDDALDTARKRKKKDIQTGFTGIVTQALTAYARNPI